MEGIIRTTVCFLCHDGNGRFLIQKRSKNARDEQGTWDGGGGGLKFGEKIEDAVRREVKEEYCADALDSSFMGYRDIHRVQNGTPTHWIALDFKIKVDPREVKIGEPHKCDELKWTTLEELKSFPGPFHSKFWEFVEKNRSHFV